MSNSFVVFCVVFCVWRVVDCDILVQGVKCGQKTCSLMEYCSDFDKICESCADACNASSHNYESVVCLNQCQNYLHDLRYVKKEDVGGENLRETVQQLSRMVTITLTLVCLMLVVLACVLVFQLYRWKDKKNITLDAIRNKFFKKQPSDNNVPKQPTTITPESKKPDLRLDMPSTVTNSDHSPVTTTTSIGRRPAEDSTLDYAYDNHAMTKSSNTSF